MVQGDHLSKIAVIAVFERSDRFSYIQKYVKELRQRGIRTVDFFIYFGNKKDFEQYQGSLKDFPFSEKGFNLFGKFIAAELQHARKETYDVVIDLSEGKSFACDVLLTKMKGRWKAGRSSSDRRFLLDFMIDMKEDQDIRNFIHHLDQYLTNFNRQNAA